MRSRILAVVAAAGTVITMSPAHAFEGMLKTKISAMRVMASQIATASKAQINASLSIAQAEMAARGVLASTVEQLRLYQDFSATNGQGAQVCDAVSQRNDIDSLGLARDKYQFTAMPDTGRSAIQGDSYPVVRAERQLDAYCSAEEHNLGVCRSRFDGMANASSNYNKLQTQDQFTTKQLAAARDYVENLVPRQAVPVQRGANCDASCQSARLAAMRADATASMISATMAMQFANRIGEKTFAEKK